MATPRPELATPRPELATPRPELATPRPELATPRPELATPRPELATPRPELATPRPELATPRPELATPRPELATPRPELATPRPELATPRPELATPRPQLATPGAYSRGMPGSAHRQSSIVIGSRFVGPPTSGNGGYTAGRLAERHGTGRTVTVTLRQPPPVETELTVHSDHLTTRLLDGDRLIGEVVDGDFAQRPADAVDEATARSAESAYAGLHDHPFPTCFVCGTDRAVGDGMRLRPGPVAPGRTACVWTPDASMQSRSSDGHADFAFVWAALDCPGGWTSDLVARPLVLGRMTCLVASLPALDEPVVVSARLLAVDGRKTRTAATAYGADGTVIGRAEHTWIAVDPTTFAGRDA